MCRVAAVPSGRSSHSTNCLVASPKTGTSTVPGPGGDVVSTLETTGSSFWKSRSADDFGDVGDFGEVGGL